MRTPAAAAVVLEVLVIVVAQWGPQLLAGPSRSSSSSIVPESDKRRIKCWQSWCSRVVVEVGVV